MAIAEFNISALTASRAAASDTNGLLVSSNVTDAELAFVSGVTSAIQTQLNAKVSSTPLSGTSAYIIPGLIDMPVAVANNTEAISPGATNEVQVFHFRIDFPITITSVISEIIANVGGSNYSLGVYNFDGSTKLLDTGLISSATAGIKTVSSLSLALTPGMYFLARVCTSTAVTIRAIQANASLMPIINTGTVAHIGKAANAGSAGALPTTLGAITADNNRNPAMVKLQG